MKKNEHKNKNDSRFYCLLRETRYMQQQNSRFRLKNERQMIEKTSKTADQITILIGSLHPGNPMLLLKLHLHGKRILSMLIDAMLSSFFASHYSVLVPFIQLKRLNIENYHNKINV